MYTFPNHANIVFRGEYYNVERVQRSFTKRLLGLWSLSYTERLLRLNLDSLESRRVKADLVLLFKVIHGFVDIDRCAIMLVYNVCGFIVFISLVHICLSVCICPL